MNYFKRTNCIFCYENLSTKLFDNDCINYNGHYAIGLNESNAQEIPYNISICTKCKTPQNTYLGDLNELYKINHADSTGSTMKGLHQSTLNLILEFKDSIKNIVEIGSSVGYLADLILNHINNIEYNIIEPSYFGDRSNKNIFEDFYENVNDSKINANTMIISHVFEHFYEPLNILEKISKNKNLENLFLIFPDFEYYINNDILHVLNSEHTYYVDNTFLINLLKLYGFEIVKKESYKNHSVLFYFKKMQNFSFNNKIEINFINENYDLNKFIQNIKNRISTLNEYMDANPDKNFYMWPSSIHSLHLCMLGLNYNKLTGLLDNSLNKIGKKIYGYNIPIFDFSKQIEKANINDTFFINGGIFNEEIKEKIKNVNVL